MPRRKLTSGAMELTQRAGAPGPADRTPAKRFANVSNAPATFAAETNRVREACPVAGGERTDFQGMIKEDPAKRAPAVSICLSPRRSRGRGLEKWAAILTRRRGLVAVRFLAGTRRAQRTRQRAHRVRGWRASIWTGIKIKARAGRPRARPGECNGGGTFPTRQCGAWASMGMRPGL